MTAKTRTVRFFEPYRRQPDGTSIQLAPEFWALLRGKVSQLPHAEQFVDIRGIEYRGDARHESSLNADYFYLGKTRDQVDFPESSVGDADEAPLTLQEGARLVEPCYLMVAESQSNTIALVRTSAGPSVSAVGEWITRFFNEELGNDSIELQPKLRGDQQQRFNDAVDITAFEISIERHHNLGDVHADTQLGAALRQSYEGLERGGLVQQKWSFGRTRPSHSVSQNMRRAIIEVLNWTVAKTAKATVVRVDSNGKEFKDTIDFVKDQVTTKVTVGDDPSVAQSPTVVVGALRSAIRQYTDSDRLQ